MIDFWILATLLMSAAVAFITVPLFRQRSQASVGEGEQRTLANVDLYNERLNELESLRVSGDISAEELKNLQAEYQRTLLADSDAVDSLPTEASSKSSGKLVLLFLALTLPVAAILFYGERGNIADWEIASLLQEKNRQFYQAHRKSGEVDGAVVTEGVTRNLVARLVERLKENPENSQNWFLLAQNQMELKSYKNARQAYGELVKRFPQDGQVLGYYAQALYLEGGGKLTPEVTAVIDRALGVDPHNTTVLGLKGISAYEAGDYVNAIAAWRKILTTLPPNSGNAQYLQRGIASAREKLIASGGQAPVDGAASKDNAVSHGVTLQVSIDPSFQTNATTTVFVYARAVGGPRMPLAITKLTVADLPKNVTLDDSMSVMSGQKMSDYPEIELVARVSRKGTPMPQSGDLEGISEPVNVQKVSAPIALVIGTRIP